MTVSSWLQKWMFLLTISGFNRIKFYNVLNIKEFKFLCRYRAKVLFIYMNIKYFQINMLLLKFHNAYWIYIFFPFFILKHFVNSMKNFLAFENKSITQFPTFFSFLFFIYFIIYLLGKFLETWYKSVLSLLLNVKETNHLFLGLNL